MKNLVNMLIGLSAVTFVIAILTKLGGKPLLAAQSGGLAKLTGILLLFAIALSVKK